MARSPKSGKDARRRIRTLLLCALAALTVAVMLPAHADARCASLGSREPADAINRFEWSGRLAELEPRLESTTAIEREQAVCELATFPGGQVIEHLRTALADESEGVQSSAIDAVGYLGLTDLSREVSLLLDARDTDIRIAAATALGDMGARGHSQKLVSALSDPSGDVKQAAIGALGKLRDPATVDALVGMLDQDARDVVVATLQVLGKFADRTTVYAILDKTRDSSKPIVLASIVALGELRDPRAIGVLVSQLRAPVPDVRRAAARALGDIGDPEAVDDLLAMLGPNESIDGVTSVVRALGRIGDPKAVLPLLSLIRHDQHASTARTALRMIGAAAVEDVLAELSVAEDPAYRAKLLAVLAELPSQDAAAFLSAALLSSDFDRNDVVEAVAMARDPEMLDVVTLVIPELTERELVTLLERVQPIADDRLIGPLVDRYPNLGTPARHAALLTMATVGSDAAIEVVAEELGNEDLDTKRLAVFAAQSIGDDAAIPGLVAALEAEDGTLRRQAAVALASNGTPASVRALLGVAQKKTHVARRDAVWALAFAVRDVTGEARAEAEAFAREILQDPSHPLAYVALEVVATVGPETLETDFARIYEGGRISLRRKVIEIVGITRATGASDLVLDALNSPDDSLRAEAAWAAGRLELVGAVPQLISLADAGAPPVTVNALASLGMLGNTDGIDVIQRRLHAPSPYVVAAAIETLHRIGAPAELWEMESAFDRTENPFVRESVYRVLVAQGESEAVERLLAREPSERMRADVRARLDGRDPAAIGDDAWVVLDLSMEKAYDRLIGEQVYLLLPDGQIKGAFTDENGKVRLELEAPGQVKQAYGGAQYVPFLEEQRH